MMRKLIVGLLMLCFTGCAIDSKRERLVVQDTVIDTASELWGCRILNNTSSELSVCAVLTRWDGVRIVLGPRVMIPGSVEHFAGMIGAKAPTFEWTAKIGAREAGPDDGAPEQKEVPFQQIVRR